MGVSKLGLKTKGKGFKVWTFDIPALCPTGNGARDSFVLELIS
jgi:hypothetical protein